MTIELVPQAVLAERFRLERVIGEGGMGVVWRATELASGTARALKVLKSSKRDDPHAHARLLREARAASRVRHANIARVHEVLELEDGQPCLVMELIEGETLARKLERGPMGVGPMARLFLQIVDAVEAAHASGIVHRDLKPDNVILVGEGVRVLDFGIAKNVSSHIDETDDASLTSTGTMIGTPHYMAPEQIFGDSDVDERADIWALGVMIYESIAGRRPTQATGIGQVLKIIATESIVPLAQVMPDAPADLTDLVAHMLTRDRTKRPSLARVREVLERCRDELAPARTSSISALSVSSGGATLDTRDPSPTPSKKIESSKRAPVWPFAIAMAVGGALLLAFLGSRPSSAIPPTPDAQAPIDPPIVSVVSPPASSSSMVPVPPPPMETHKPTTIVPIRTPIDAGRANDAGAVSPTRDAGSGVKILTNERT